MLLRADSRIFVLSFVILAGQAALLCERIAAGETRTTDRPGLRAGAQAIDVSPRTFPVLINGGFLQNSATRVNDPLFAKCLVLDGGKSPRGKVGDQSPHLAPRRSHPQRPAHRRSS